MRTLLSLSLLIAAPACVNQHIEPMPVKPYLLHGPDNYEWSPGDYLVLGTFGWCGSIYSPELC